MFLASMMPALIVFGVVMVLSAIALVVAVRTAPEGIEDENGFHAVENPQAAASPTLHRTAEYELPGKVNLSL